MIKHEPFTTLDKSNIKVFTTISFEHSDQIQADLDNSEALLKNFCI